jgi:hypothetical protein
MRNKSDEALALITENIEKLCEKNTSAMGETVERWSRWRTNVLIDQKKYEEALFTVRKIRNKNGDSLGIRSQMMDVRVMQNDHHKVRESEKGIRRDFLEQEDIANWQKKEILKKFDSNRYLEAR